MLRKVRPSMISLVVTFVLTCGFTVPSDAQNRSTDYQQGDRVEVKDGFDWKPGTVVGASVFSGQFEVRLDNLTVPLPSNMPADVRERFHTRPFRLEEIRPLPDTSQEAGGAGASSAAPSLPLRTWADTTGRFSVDARFGGLDGTDVVLIREDGQKIRVPIERLSAADAQYARDTNASTENPFQLVPEPNTPLPQARMLKANWRDARAVRPRSLSSWSFTPKTTVADNGVVPSTPAANGEWELADLPGSDKFFENVLGLHVSGDGGRAVVWREQGKVSQDRLHFVDLIDVGNGTSQGPTPLPPETVVLDVYPDESLVMYRPEVFGFGEKTTLTIARIDSGRLTPLVQWEPYVHEDWEPRRDIDSGWFLSSDRLMTISHHGEALTVWDASTAKALLNIPVRTAINLKTALNADRSLLAIIMKEGIAIIDLVAGRHVATLPAQDKSYSAVQFKDDNTHLAGKSNDGVTVWDLTNGQVTREFHQLAMRNRASLAWAGEYLLMGNQYLFDVERRILLWEYQRAPREAAGARLHAGRMWALTDPTDGQPTVLTSSAFPHAEALNTAAALPSAADLLVVKPGDAIAIETDIDPSIASSEEIRQSLGASLEAAGLRVVNESDLVLRVICKPQQPQTIRINADGRFPVREGDIVERTVTPHASYLEMRLAGDIVWKRGYLARPGVIILIRQGESIDDALKRLTTPNLEVLKSAKFSGFVAKPGKATPNGAYGVSRYSSRGLIHGVSSGGDEVFE